LSIEEGVKQEKDGWLRVERQAMKTILLEGMA